MARTLEDHQALLDQAHARGAEHGRAQAGWYFDGNTSLATYKIVLAQLEDGDPGVYDTFPSPISGEWAGDTTPDSVLWSLGLTATDEAADDVLAHYEDGFGVAYADEVERVARMQLAGDEEYQARAWREAVIEAASSAARSFTRRHRVDGSGYTTLVDGRPEWVMEMVRDAHGTMLPDDRIYELSLSACQFIRDESDYDDRADEYADSMVDVYNSELVKWLGSGGRFARVDEAREEWGEDPDASIGQLIQRGQLIEAREVFGIVAQAIEDRASHRLDERS